MEDKTIDAVSASILRAAESYTVLQSTGLTQKRLLYEFLAYPGRNGKTLSGLFAKGVEPSDDAPLDLLYIVIRWFGRHICKHYYMMRQFKEAGAIVEGFLKYLKTEAVLPAYLGKELDAALQVAAEGAKQVLHCMRIMRQPDARNEAFAKVYPLRPFPLCLVPPASPVKESSSRHWPQTPDQAHQTWLTYTSDRCKVEPEELEALIQAVPKKLCLVGITEGKWEVLSVNPDSSITFRQYKGDQQYTIQFSEKRAADFLPGMVVMATFVELSDGTLYATDWGFVYPTFYAPLMDHVSDFGQVALVKLVYKQGWNGYIPA